MLHDRRGIVVTTDNPAAVGRLDEAVSGLLGHRADTAAHLAAALAADGELVTGHCLNGFLHLLLGRAELLPPAKRAWEMASAALAWRPPTPRERLLTEALGAWCSGDMESAATRLDEVLAAHPLDAMTAKLVQSLRFMLGDATGMRRSIERALRAWASDVPGYGYMLGCHAFALEETGAFDDALRIGQHALEHEWLDVWACHAVAHVHEMRGTPDQGLAWITAHAGRWSTVNNFARHMDWHEALFRLARREIDAVLALYDGALRADKSDDYRDIANAASLLHRLERQGVAVGTRWAELADLAERRIHDHALAFAQLHYLLCLVGDRRWDQAFELFAAMDIEGRSGHGTQARLLRDVGVPLAKIILAATTRNADHVLDQLAPHAITRLGGSAAQRQIFEQILRTGGARPAMPVRRNMRAVAAASPLLALAH
jgi:hypothetical protein